VRQVLARLLDQSFFTNQKKCSFGNSKVRYLGHIISKEDMAMDLQKIEAILQQLPKNLRAEWILSVEKIL